MQRPRPLILISPKLPNGVLGRCSGRAVFTFTGLLVALTLGACTEVVESLNPGRLFGDGTVEPPPPGAEQDFPNLATVPEKPRKSSTMAEIKEIREGLVADRERARYTDQELRASSTDDVDFAAATEAAKARAAASAESKASRAPAEGGEAASAEPAKQGAIDGPSNAILRFEPGSSELSNEAIEQLGRVILRLGEVGGALRVVGHAPPAKQGTGGKALAIDRAVAVATELERLGVPAERMQVSAGEAGKGVDVDRVDVVIVP